MSNILIYTYGDSRCGLGHLKRCLVLADELKSRGHRIEFLTHAKTAGEDVISHSDHAGTSISGADILESLVPTIAGFNLAIIDIADGPSGEMISLFKKQFTKVVVISAAGYAP